MSCSCRVLPKVPHCFYRCVVCELDSNLSTVSCRARFGAAEKFKLRSYLQPLELGRDWIHVSSPQKYAHEMNIRR